ncbi:MAG: hypothetical protein H7Y13_03625 [Sphingobacteriaceae bacterium]|nr:hypothetical protein [Sphingobacteriaceae bacterium]
MKFLGTLLCLAIVLISCQKKPQEIVSMDAEISAFKRADSLNFPPPKGLLFIGSSSIKLWNDLEVVFKDYGAINRGFGGSTLLDAKHYAKDIIFPYHPRQIVIYSGENDLLSDTVTAIMLLGRFKVLFETIRREMPEVAIAYISIKPCPGRKHYIPLIRECNALLKSYILSQEKAVFIDVFTPLTRRGQLRPELYREDAVHLNDKGYEIWVKAIAPYLVKKQ